MGLRPMTFEKHFDEWPSVTEQSITTQMREICATRPWRPHAFVAVHSGEHKKRAVRTGNTYGILLGYCSQKPREQASLAPQSP